VKTAGKPGQGLFFFCTESWLRSKRLGVKLLQKGSPPSVGQLVCGILHKHKNIEVEEHPLPHAPFFLRKMAHKQEFTCD